MASRKMYFFGDSNSCYFFLRRLEKLGALEWTKVVHKHQGWRLVTCMWLHAGIIHLVVNMFSLVFIGIRLEQQFGFGMLCCSIISTKNLISAKLQIL